MRDINPDEIDADLLSLVEKGLLDFAYDEELGDWVFWLKGVPRDTGIGEPAEDRTTNQ